MSNLERLSMLLEEERRQHASTRAKLEKAKHDADRYRRRIAHLQSVLKQCGMFIAIAWKPERMQNYLEAIEKKTTYHLSSERSA